MQTFLPYESFERSARVLDCKRLGKQRLEAKSIIRINVGETSGGSWKSHPAVLMWRGYEPLLSYYGLIITDEWIRRGYKDQQRSFFTLKLKEFGCTSQTHLDLLKPSWLGKEELHQSHRANLLRKEPKHYEQFWDEDPSIPYYWPVTWRPT